MKRKDFNWTPTTFDKILNALAWMMLILLPAYAWLQYEQLPNRIVTHINMDGKADNSGSRMTIWILPALYIVLFFLFRWLQGKPHWFNYPVKVHTGNASVLYRITRRFMQIMLIMIGLLFMVILAIIIHISTSGGYNSAPEWLVLIIIPFSMLPVLVYLFLATRYK